MTVIVLVNFRQMKLHNLVNFSNPKRQQFEQKLVHQETPTTCHPQWTGHTQHHGFHEDWSSEELVSEIWLTIQIESESRVPCHLVKTNRFYFILRSCGQNFVCSSRYCARCGKIWHLRRQKFACLKVVLSFFEKFSKFFFDFQW